MASPCNASHRRPFRPPHPRERAGPGRSLGLRLHSAPSLPARAARSLTQRPGRQVAARCGRARHCSPRALAHRTCHSWCHALSRSAMRTLSRPGAPSALAIQSFGECQRTKSSSNAPGFAALKASMSAATGPRCAGRHAHQHARACTSASRVRGDGPAISDAVCSLRRACAPSGVVPSASKSRMRSLIMSSVSGPGSWVTGT